MRPTNLSRRAVRLGALPLLAAFAPPRNRPAALQCTGFVIDLTPVADFPDHAEIVTALQASA